MPPAVAFKKPDLSPLMGRIAATIHARVLALASLNGNGMTSLHPDEAQTLNANLEDIVRLQKSAQVVEAIIAAENEE